jgi:molecular chaperone GrpE (heat shock protein)
MSSSLNIKSIWSQFTERDVLQEAAPRSPHLEIMTVLQAWYTHRKVMEKQIAETEDRWLDRLAELTVFIYHLEQCLEEYQSCMAEQGLTQAFRHLQMIKNQVVDTIRKTGIVILDPKKCKYAQISDLVNVIDWVYKQEFLEEVVTGVKDPVILYNERVLRLGRVVMGAPDASRCSKIDKKENQNVEADHK